ncbi:hypothetical protein M569_14163 [Genlisea aurea]|uniref:Calcineurin-like phosphoesterase domain-containing protein n=1 Tax=Genlisea aurea TaxID=192259 RepID=S8C8B3_9LAMI|nr:hypothetical protein M569_14163 [Genlisea aurea]
MDNLTISFFFFFFFCSSVVHGLLRFNGGSGEFKILQIADMHYADGKTTPCEDVFPDQMPWCSDLNTTAFVARVILAENPDLLVFTGDNIYGPDATNAAGSLDAALAPAIASGIPWAAVLGNHDQESTLTRQGVMQHIVGMENTVSLLNPPDGADSIDGFGTYNLEVYGVDGTNFSDKSILNLYFVDSGDYSTVPIIPGYGWIKPSQQQWYKNKAAQLKSKYGAAPGVAYFHIPLPEYAKVNPSNIVGVKQEGISSPVYNSGFFSTLAATGDVKAVFVGHDHLNDFCGQLTGINLCYAGGFGYHAYGKAGWSRRARVVSVSLGKTDAGTWATVKSIRTWKRLDDDNLTAIDDQILWSP